MPPLQSSFKSEGTFPSKKSILAVGHITGEAYPRVLFLADGNVLIGDGITEPIIQVPWGDFSSHILDPIDAHDASAISFVPAGTIAATDVQAAVEEVNNEKQAAINTVQTNLDNHINDTVDAHDASAISYAGGLGLSSTEVEAALDTLASRYVICTSGTRPGSPFEGEIIYETDTNRVYVYDGAAWKFVYSTTSEDEIYAEASPGANTDATNTAAWVDWFTIGNITIPSWATKARVQMDVSNFFSITSGQTFYLLRSKIGTDLPAHSGVAGFKGKTDIALGLRDHFAFHDTITLTATGAQSLKVMANRQGGTGQWRADTSAIFSAKIQFLP